MAVETGFNVKGDLDKVGEYASNITKNLFETSHSDDIRKAAEILAGVLENMQLAKFPRLASEVSDLKNDVAKINLMYLRPTKDKR